MRALFNTKTPTRSSTEKIFHWHIFQRKKIKTTRTPKHLLDDLVNAKASLGYDWALLRILLWLKFALMRAQWPTLWQWIAAVGRASNLLTSARTEMCACPGSVQQWRHTLLFLVFYFWCTRYGMRYSQWELVYHISGMVALSPNEPLKMLSH